MAGIGGIASPGNWGVITRRHIGIHVSVQWRGNIGIVLCCRLCTLLLLKASHLRKAHLHLRLRRLLLLLLLWWRKGSLRRRSMRRWYAGLKSRWHLTILCLSELLWGPSFDGLWICTNAQPK